jgi:hypothetical protein
MRILACLVTVLTLAASPAHAEDDDPGPPTRSYGKYVLAVDAASVGLLIAGGLSEGSDGEDSSVSGALFTAGALGVMFGGPIVHLSRGHGVRALGSLGLRYAGIMGGALVAVKLSNCANSDELFCELEAAGPGILIGFVVASVIDGTLNSNEPIAEPTWTPTVSATQNGGSVGLFRRW